MAVHYKPFDGKQVSVQWHVVLTGARKARVRFKLNSGHRSMTEQTALYRQNMSGGRPRAGRPLTAVPSPFAPHIRVGRIDHALDVDATDGGSQRLANWLRRQGARVAFTVAGEPWHMETPASDLKRLAAKLKDSPLTDREERWVERLKYHRKRKSKKDRRWARWYAARIAARMVALRVAGRAEKNGWRKRNRGVRYQLLGRALHA